MQAKFLAVHMPFRVLQNSGLDKIYIYLRSFTEQNVSILTKQYYRRFYITQSRRGHADASDERVEMHKLWDKLQLHDSIQFYENALLHHKATCGTRRHTLGILQIAVVSCCS
jgi:hypothetical protein